MKAVVEHLVAVYDDVVVGNVDDVEGCGNVAAGKPALQLRMRHTTDGESRSRLHAGGPNSLDQKSV